MDAIQQLAHLCANQSRMPGMLSKAHFERFINEFEDIFVIQSNGTLKCDQDTMARAAKWFNDNKLAIMLISGVDCPDLHFNPTGHSDITVVNQNKTHLLHYYSVAFTGHELVQRAKIKPVSMLGKQLRHQLIFILRGHIQRP